MPVVKCAVCKTYVDRETAIRNGVQSVCADCGVTPLYKQNRIKKRTKSKDTPDELREFVLRLDGRCRFCGSRDGLHAHHVIYRSSQGPHEQSNLLSLCWTCHDVVHSDKKRYQPLCLGVIWLRSMGNKQVLIPQLEKKLNAIH